MTELTEEERRAEGWAGKGQQGESAHADVRAEGGWRERKEPGQKAESQKRVPVGII